MNIREMTRLALLTAMALLLHIAEGLIPLSLPMGVKPGLANIITLFALLYMDLGSALTITCLRTVLGSLMGGTLLSVTFLMSFGGGMTAALIMFALLKCVKGLSPVGISIGGAAAHNLAQLGIAACVIGNTAIYYYLPILLLAAIPMGLLTGSVLRLCGARLAKAMK